MNINFKNFICNSNEFFHFKLRIQNNRHRAPELVSFHQKSKMDAKLEAKFDLSEAQWGGGIL